MSQQKALFLEAAHGDFRVRTKDIPQPGPGQVVIKVHAAGLNPVDWKIREFNVLVSSYPAILGFDVAGTVETIGEGVQNLSKGDRVLTQGNALDSRAAAYQQYVFIPAELVCKIPSNISFDEAASIPSCLVTASAGLYLDKPERPQKYTPPWEEGGLGRYAGQPIVIIGGASSVGQYTIQLAKLSGFSPIITTASAHNAEHLRSLGATHVIDRSADDVDAKITEALGKTPVKIIFDTISSPDTQARSWDLLGSGGQLILVHEANVDEDKYKDKVTIGVHGISHIPPLRTLIANFFTKLTKLIEDGSIKPNRVEVLPNGLGGIPDGLERIKSDKVSGKKLIARPQETV